MATPQQLTVIHTLLTWSAQLAYSSFAASVYEDALRGALVDKALLSGWTLAVNRGTPLHNLSLAGSVLNNAPSAIQQNTAHKPDIRIVAPVFLVVELKIRGDFGSSITSSTNGISGDFEHVATGQADIFLLVADGARYDALRAGGAATTFANELPNRAQIGTSPAVFQTTRTIATGAIVQARTLAVQVPSAFGARVVTAFYV